MVHSYAILFVFLLGITLSASENLRLQRKGPCRAYDLLFYDLQRTREELERCQDFSCRSMILAGLGEYARPWSLVPEESLHAAARAVLGSLEGKKLDPKKLAQLYPRHALDALVFVDNEKLGFFTDPVEKKERKEALQQARRMAALRILQDRGALQWREGKPRIDLREVEAKRLVRRNSGLTAHHLLDPEMKWALKELELDRLADSKRSEVACVDDVCYFPVDDNDDSRIRTVTPKEMAEIEKGLKDTSPREAIRVGEFMVLPQRQGEKPTLVLHSQYEKATAYLRKVFQDAIKSAKRDSEQSSNIFGALANIAAILGGDASGEDPFPNYSGPESVARKARTELSKLGISFKELKAIDLQRLALARRNSETLDKITSEQIPLAVAEAVVLLPALLRSPRAVLYGANAQDMLKDVHPDDLTPLQVGLALCLTQRRMTVGHGVTTRVGKADLRGAPRVGHAEDPIPEPVFDIPTLTPFETKAPGKLSVPAPLLFEGMPLQGARVPSPLHQVEEGETEVRLPTPMEMPVRDPNAEARRLYGKRPSLDVPFVAGGELKLPTRDYLRTWFAGSRPGAAGRLGQRIKDEMSRRPLTHFGRPGDGGQVLKPGDFPFAEIKHKGRTYFVTTGQREGGKQVVLVTQDPNHLSAPTEWGRITPSKEKPQWKKSESDAHLILKDPTTGKEFTLVIDDNRGRARWLVPRMGTNAEMEKGFLQDIIENPDDDAPRLIFADWLDDTGNSERATFIRNSVKYARLPDGEEKDSLEESMTKWEDKTKDKHWKRAIAMVLRFDRGFINEVVVHNDQQANYFPQLLEREPITNLTLNGYGVPIGVVGIEEILRQPQLKRIRRLTVTLADDHMPVYAKYRNLENVEELTITDTFFTSGALRALDDIAFPKVKVLTFNAIHAINARGATDRVTSTSVMERLGRTRLTAQAEQLNIGSYNNESISSFLAQGKDLPKLRRLTIRPCYAPALQPPTASFPNLEHLELQADSIENYQRVLEQWTAPSLKTVTIYDGKGKTTTLYNRGKNGVVKLSPNPP